MEVAPLLQVLLLLMAFAIVVPPASAQGPATARSQTPRPPYPYAVEEVTYRNDGDSITLAGTLTLPHGRGPFPAVVLLSVAGPNDRDQSHSGHKPYHVLADHLTRRGFAVLRSDDRGVGGSSGSGFLSTLDDLAEDALAAMAFLGRRNDIDSTRIGVLGNSEGAAVGALAAARSSRVAFLVMLAGPGLDGRATIRLQQERLARQQNFTEAEVEATLAHADRMFDVVLSTNTHEVKAQLLRELSTNPGVRIPKSVDFAGPVEQQIQLFLSPWYRSQLAYDPTVTLRTVHVPLLALGGDRDPFVPADAHLPAIRRALEISGHTDATVRVMPGLNHVFQPARTGALSEYARIDVSFATDALQVISSWLEARFLR